MKPQLSLSLWLAFAFTHVVLHAQEVVEERAAVPKTPMLRIEIGMHTAPIKRISTDAQQDILVSASNDKTVRVWDLKTQRLLRVLRPPINLANDGMLYCAAISPDGKTVACGGLTGYDWDGDNYIYIFDPVTGKLLRRLKGPGGVITHLVFSQDGKYLAATAGGGFGLAVYRTTDYSVVAKDTDYNGGSYGADFGPSGILLTTCEDGYLRLYDDQFKLVAKHQTQCGKDPVHVAFSTDGAYIAIGFNDAPRVEVFDLKSKQLVKLGKENDDFILSAVAWSISGNTLYAAGTLSDDKNRKFIRVWQLDRPSVYRDWLTPAANLITQLLPRKEGGLLFACADPGYGALDASGRVVFYKNSLQSDFRGMSENFRVSETGSIVDFRYSYLRQNMGSFFVEERVLDDYDPQAEGMYEPQTEGLPLTRESIYELKLGEKLIKLRDFERPLSVAIAFDKQSFLLGCDFTLRRYDASGKEIWERTLTTAAWAVNITPDKNLAVAALGDGTIRWFRYDDGQELLAFFPTNDGKRWVTWTPEGYYDASPGGENLIGWHLNQGKAKESMFFSASRFRNKFYRPDVIAKVLQMLDVENALLAADEERGLSKSASKQARKTFQLKEVLPPVVSILSPENGTVVSSPQVLLHYAIESPSGEPVTAVKILVDGRPVANTRGLKKTLAAGVSEEQVTVMIPERDCEISILAENKSTVSDPASVRIVWKGAAPAQDEFIIKPKLYALVIGISNYKDSDLQLGLAAKDARDFAQALLSQKGGLYQDVNIRLLTDQQATKDDVLDGLEWLQAQVTSKDVGMLFFAGHGINDNSGTFYLLPVNAELEKLKRTCLEFSQVKTTIAALAGKAVIFLDACHSGNAMGGTQRRSATADITAAVNELGSAENGAVVFSSSTGRQYSLEDAAWGNGAFTRALLEGLSGKADLMGKGKITVNMLDAFISERVKELTKGKQTPTTVRPPNVPDFPVALKLKK